MRKAERARQAAAERLREILKPGDTVKTILVHVSRSGMMRRIRVFAPDMRDISYLAAEAIGETSTSEGVKITGCGMDMGFHIVYSMSRAMFPDGFNCIGKPKDETHWSKWCPANDHANGERSYAKTIKHSDGGYALKQEWL